MAEIYNSDIQNLLNADADNFTVGTQKNKHFPKLAIFVIIIAIILLCAVVLKIFQSDSYEKVETYRGVCWGMTREEIDALETNRGNTIIDAGFDDNRVAYTTCDLLDAQSETNRCVYTFDGEKGVLTSFQIGSLDDGENLFTTVVTDLVELYGEGEYSQAKKDGILFLNANWSNEHETVEGLLFASSSRSEAYFTFTYNDNMDDSE